MTYITSKTINVEEIGPLAEDLKVEIFDSMGALVSSYETIVAQGVADISIPLPKLNPGIYVYHISSGLNQLAKKFLLVQ